MSAYKVIRGVSYGKKRAEAGATVTDLPSESIAWLLAAGVIEPADDSKQSKPKAKSEPVSNDKGDK